MNRGTGWMLAFLFALRAAGYHTALVGKWHLGVSSPNTPSERGFDFFHGFLGDMMDDYTTHLRNGHNYMRKNLETVDPRGHATDVFTGWACDYLKERAKAGGPFFLDLAYNAPHDPIQPRPDWLEKVQKREPGLSEKRAKRVALTMDIFATACAAAGVKSPAGIDGVSFLPTLFGEPEPATARTAYYVRREGGPNYGGKTIEALRCGAWKRVQDSPYAPSELYTLFATCGDSVFKRKLKVRGLSPADGPLKPKSPKL